MLVSAYIAFRARLKYKLGIRQENADVICPHPEVLVSG